MLLENLLPGAGAGAGVEEPSWSFTDLVDHLRAMGLAAGETLLVHSSLRSIGTIAGGPAELLRALLTVLGPEGTLVVYTACPENSDTSRMARALVEGRSPQEQSRHQAGMPAFDREVTRSTPLLGWFSEEVRAHPRAVRSDHPQTSFTAIGRDAVRLMAEHELHSHLGPHSPVQKLYDGGARALLIGLPIWNITPVHLAEYWLERPPMQLYGCVMEDKWGRHWRHFQAVEIRDGHLEDLGRHLDRELTDRVEGQLGAAHCYLVPIRKAVNLTFAFLQKTNS
ncbi:aminoglycoside N3'-acetyltransferase [Kitasatospora paracochleata]|uniref:Aminoglycoside N(3)-acetyltransferase n=1 Tax=Kitasatospora paracochleata TaxID=58354 RepID=A0ABT1IPT1_9ACTN|nr:AAC(3) family N-acetyltransferase [Kitasatospora paracochleata]MCP2307132.1 aminoglycoside 3-N-acetyltransferase [Kitasatospora paracochleata]